MVSRLIRQGVGNHDQLHGSSTSACTLSVTGLLLPRPGCTNPGCGPHTKPHGSTSRRSGGTFVASPEKQGSGLQINIVSAEATHSPRELRQVIDKPNVAWATARAFSNGSNATTWIDARNNRRINSNAGDPSVAGVPGFSERPSTATQRGLPAST